MRSAFFDQPVDEQIKSFELHTRKLLTNYPIEILSVESINFEFNATFKVESVSGEKFALRINVNSHRTLSNALAEIAFIGHLEPMADIKVPTPIATTAGEFVLSIPHEDSNRVLTSVMYSWLEGEELGDEPSAEQLFKLGATMAKMHLVTNDLKLPGEATLPIYKDVLWGEENLLLSKKVDMPGDARESFKGAFALIQRELDALSSQGVPKAIHADLHGWNVMWDEPEIAIFDFDDSGIGFPIQDLATAIYYLDTEEQVLALRSGYESISTIPEHASELMETLLLQRRLILMNYLYGSTNGEYRAMIPDYLEETLRRVEKLISQMKN